MDAPRLTDVCDRLVARFADRTLTRFELIDMATVLMLVRHDLEQGIAVQDRSAIDTASTPLRWIHDQAQDASVAALRSHVAAAVARFTAHVPAHDTAQPHPTSRQPSNQERVHA